jgi:hypothetical protein
MKRIIYLICMTVFSLSFEVKAQDIFLPEIEPLLSPMQKQELEKAVNILLKARGNENNANDIESKYSKLKKKGKEKSWIEKTWEAKQQRIMAEKNYKLAYQNISAVYAQLIKSGKYATDADKEEAISLDKDSQTKFVDSDQIFSKLPEQTKEALEIAPNDEIEKTLANSHSMKLSAIRQQIIALQKIVGVGEKEAISKTDDDLAWETAKSANTIDAYYNYLNENPRGRHMHDANELINQIEKGESGNEVASSDVKNGVNNSKNINPKNNKDNSKDNGNNSNNKNPKDKNKTNTANTNSIVGDLVFKVQIAAATTEISEWMLNAKAPGTKDIQMLKSGVWYKYLAGSFNTYSEAASLRDELRSNVPDAFIVVLNKGKQIPITEKMKN